MTGVQTCALPISIKLSLNIFNDSISDLLSSISKFKAESASPDFWNRPQRPFVERLELSIQRGVFSSAMSAMALVDHSRKFSKKHTIPDYDNQISKFFINNEEHRFIHSLRTYITHVRVTEANWQISHSKEGRLVQFLLSKEDLLKYKKWKSLAKKFIRHSSDGIIVEAVFEKYAIKVKEFHCWLHDAIIQKYSKDISDYLKYKKILDQFDSYSHWSVLIQQGLFPKKLNPYLYLNRYLTPQEMKDVLTLPHRSKQQVDKIIQFVDEYNVCDMKLRRLIYQLFEVKKT